MMPLHKSDLFLKSVLAGLFLLSVLPVALAVTPPTIDHKQGSRVALALPLSANDAQFALIPGGPYLKSSVALQTAALSVVARGRYAFVAAGEGGLQIFESSPDSPQRLVAQVMGQGKITRVVLQDEYVYLADDSGELRIVDVADPQHPQQVSSYPLTQPLDALGVGQGRAYLVGGKQLTILDVSHPQAPQPIASFTLSSEVTALQVADSNLYLAQQKAGLGILDVSDPAHIRETGRFRGNVKDVFVSGGHAFLANGETGLTLLEVSQPHTPRWLGSINGIGTALSLSFDQGFIAMRNDRSELLFIDARNPKLPKVVAVHHADHEFNAIALAQPQILAGTNAGLETIDFSDPIPNVANMGANFGGSRRAVIRDNILYVADWFSGLHLYDISEPNSPRHLSNYHTQGSSKGVLVRGDYAFVADDDHGVQILNIKDPKQPRKIAEVATPGLAYTMKLAGDYLYLADHRGGFHIISVADIAHPVIVGSARTSGKAWAVEVVGSLAYVAADNAGLLVFDISDPRQPVQLAAYDMGGAAEDVVIRDRFAYVTSFDNGLHILNISQPLQAKELSHFTTPGNARGIELAGDLAYIADWVSGIQIVNIVDPARPVAVGAYDTTGWSWGVRVRDHYAYVLDWWGGVVVLDVSDPTTPTLAGAYHSRGLTRDVVVSNDYAFVADGSNGLQIFDVKNPLNPIWMVGVDMPGDAQSVWLEKNIAYLATGKEGIAKVDISNPFQPHLLKQYTDFSPWDETTRPSIKLQKKPFKSRVSKQAGDEPKERKAEQPLNFALVRAHGNLIYAADPQQGVAIINATSGQQVAWIASVVNDLSLANKRLYLATPTDVEVFEVSAPRHPHLEKRLPQIADRIRTQKNLLVLYNRIDGITLYDNSTLKPLGSFNPGEEIVDLKISGRQLYASGKLSGLLVFDISNPRHPVLSAAYPAAGKVTQLSVFSGAVFMAGNETLAEVRLLPKVKVTPVRQGEITVTAPKDMPLGCYHLLSIDANKGSRVTYPNALCVVMPITKKPRFTLQDLDRAMRKLGLNPALHQ